MRKVRPTVRLSFSLTLLTLSVLLFGQLLGLLPNRISDEVARRVGLVETLALHVAVDTRDPVFVQRTLAHFVRRHETVESAGLRNSAGSLVVAAGEHARHWTRAEDGPSSITRVHLPIPLGTGGTGQLEVQFHSLWAGGILQFMFSSSVGLLLFVAVVSFLLYLMFLHRALRELNPSAAIPDRVRTAFDVLAEGVMVLDGDNTIVMANSSIAGRLSATPFELIGKRPGAFDWRLPEDNTSESGLLPWDEVARHGQRVTGQQLQLLGKSVAPATFMVNCAPIVDADGKPRGALVTFDDLSEVERRNRELNDTLGELQDSRAKISAKNKELEILATRDPLTGCLNRRALFESFDDLLAEARADGTPLSCFMVDIDHFKSVNDRFGHGVGDEVIRQLARVLTNNARAEDLVGRYGGEEFCVVSPGLGIERALEVAERFRRAVAEMGSDTAAGLPLRVTASFGVAHLTDAVANPSELVGMADQALYVAKESGRNRVCRYDTDAIAGKLTATEPSSAEATPTQPPAAVALPSATNDAADSPTPTDNTHEQVVELQAQVTLLQAELDHRSSVARRQALHDDNTGLPNKTLLLDRLTQAIERANRYDNSIALLSMEIATVDRVNQVFGPAVSERLLHCVLERLGDLIRRTDTLSLVSATSNDTTLSRIGSNEFGVLLCDLTDLDAVTLVVNRIHRALDEPFTIDDKDMYVSANVGISLCPHDTTDADILLRNAAAARQHARLQDARVNLEYYSEDINRTSEKQLQIESLLHQALANNELSLHFQTQNDLAADRICGVEALLRWHSPQLGQVSPAEFIPIAERSGIMSGITDWVLECACAQLKAWAPLGLGDFRIAINLSPVELRSPHCAARLLAIIEQAGVSPEQIEIEVTESAVMENMGNAVGSLRTLREAGVTVALDDFGTGYSSLAHLSALPLDVVKIDGAFIKDLDHRHARTVVESIIAIAAVTGLQVVAEGVEEHAQAAVLRKLGCGHLQGYLFTKPVPAAAATELLVADLSRQKAPPRNVPRWFASR